MEVWEPKEGRGLGQGGPLHPECIKSLSTVSTETSALPSLENKLPVLCLMEEGQSPS